MADHDVCNCLSDCSLPEEIECLAGSLLIVSITSYSCLSKQNQKTGKIKSENGCNKNSENKNISRAPFTRLFCPQTGR